MSYAYLFKYIIIGDMGSFLLLIILPGFSLKFLGEKKKQNKHLSLLLLLLPFQLRFAF
jgi:hypothetical protein